MSNHEASINHYDVIIVGGGQAGITMSYYLQKAKLSHLVFEKNTVFHGWKNERWDSFTLVTPNWQCDLPGLAYDGDDPKGFMTGKQTIEWLNRFGDKVNAPVKEGVTVKNVLKTKDNNYRVETSQEIYCADQIIVASGGYHVPIIPRMAEKIPKSIHQIHSANYKNSQQLPEGNVLVVGSGQSGAQIAEDLHLAGKKVFLATGNAPRVARFYRGKDVVEWLDDMGYYQMSVKEHSLGENVRQNTNHYVTGRDGGRDIDLRKFATEGMELFGLMTDYQDGKLIFNLDLKDNLEKADNTYNNINTRIDAWIEQQGLEVKEPPSQYSPVWQPETERGELNLAESGITSIIWCIGFKPGFEWLNAPVFNGQGHPQHDRGITSEAGLYFIGLPWLHTWGSGRFSGVKSDAEYLIDFISKYQTNLKTAKHSQVHQQDTELA